jgi:hypothetical protein
MAGWDALIASALRHSRVPVDRHQDCMWCGLVSGIEFAEKYSIKIN